MQCERKSEYVCERLNLKSHFLITFHFTNVAYCKKEDKRQERSITDTTSRAGLGELHFESLEIAEFVMLISPAMVI